MFYKSNSNTNFFMSKLFFDTIILILFFSSELYILLSADLTLIKCRLKTQNIHYKTLPQSFLKFFAFQSNIIFAKQVLTLYRIKVFFFLLLSKL